MSTRRSSSQWWVLFLCISVLVVQGFRLPQPLPCTTTRRSSSSSTKVFAPLRRTTAFFSTLEQSEVEVGSEEEDKEDLSALLPTRLLSARNIDYVPLANMLMIRDYLAADQFTRDVLIKLCGAEEEGRNFVYWTEVQKIPETDMKTIEKLWLTFSNGKFGYSTQSRLYTALNGNFDNFIRRIGWTMVDPVSGNERKLKWFGANEFKYDLDTAPIGHLPLTSALRGTQLLKMLMTYPLWTKYDWKDYQSVPWE